MMNAKMMASGGAAKKGMKAGGMAMVMKDGKKVPGFAADGKGKMAMGGMATKGYAAGGAVKKGGAARGKVRGAGIAIKGTRPAKMM